MRWAESVRCVGTAQLRDAEGMEPTEARERLQWPMWPMWAVAAVVWGTGNEALV